MNRLKRCFPFLLVLFIVLPSNLVAQEKVLFKSKMGINGTLHTYNSESYSFSPKLQLTYADFMHSSIGPLFKSNKNFKTIGLDFSSQVDIHIRECKRPITPIVDIGFQYFKTKSASDSIKKNIYLMTGLGFYYEYKYLSTSLSFGFGMNAVTSKSDLWFIKIVVGCPNLYSYKSLYQGKTKSKRQIKS